MSQLGFLVDMEKCTGCKGCEMACKTRNKLNADEPRLRRVRMSEEGTFPDTKLLNMSLSCMHCDNPPCVANCPAGAIEKDKETGVVRQDPDMCIGCGTCIQVCPYGVPQYMPDDKTMRKCDFCADRREMGLDPQCVQTCFNHALVWGEMDELEKMAEGRTRVEIVQDIETDVTPSVIVIA